MLTDKLKQTPSLYKLFATEEMPLCQVLATMEHTGVAIDVPYLQQQSQDIATALSKLEIAAHAEADESFNLNSPKQLQHILYEKLQLPVLRKTPKGQASTNETALQDLVRDNIENKLPEIILEHRHLSKLKSTYTDKLPKEINHQTNRVHTTYQQAGVITGRLSSINPNLQNIPIRSATGRKIREAFIAKPGYKILSADYSQIELRIMAHLSGDPALVQAFSNSLDIHRATAAEIFAIPLEDVTTEQRRRAKAVNFGLIYGMSAFGLAKQLHIDRKEASQYVKTYFERYPKVAEYMENTRAVAAQQGYVETIFGRRLYINDINSSNHIQKQAAQRAAINAPMQGSAADIIKRAMLLIHSWLQQETVNAIMIMQVHDELVFEAEETKIDNIKAIITNHMQTAAKLTVPLIVDVGVGDNWDVAH
ncbi:MAG: hypothetical protein COC15_05055 [Legionellales bacterium]|nr:MAG: hypothetical protein COC15_05055 [Legionellales bacterium]